MFSRRYGKTGPLVLVLHGGPAACGDVVAVAKGISHSFRAIEPWQRGSDSQPLTVARHVADLHELVVELDSPSPPAIVGHSWGAMLALCYAAKFPTEAGPIVLVGCGTFDKAARVRMHEILENRTDDDLRDRLLRMSTATTDPASRFIQEFKMTRHLFDFEPIDAYPNENEFEPFDLKANEETWSDMLRLQSEGIYPKAFSNIESPVLMLHGQYDPHPGKMIRDSLIRHIPQLEYCEWERCGHYPWIERATRDDFFMSVCEWLTTKTR
jgi:pimeloyl-ACP methyl ester carboxylesterase